MLTQGGGQREETDQEELAMSLQECPWVPHPNACSPEAWLQDAQVGCETRDFEEHNLMRQ